MFKTSTNTVQKILKSFSEILHLDICFHDRLNLSQLSASWQRHTSRPCEIFKVAKGSHALCIEFDLYKIHEMLLKNPAARVVKCPAGYWQIVAGVFCDGIFAGVVFIGPFWTGREKTPCDELSLVKKSAIPSILTVAEALATQIGKHLLDVSSDTTDRRQKILRFVQSNLATRITLADIAKHMNLSRSRMGHVIKELCGVTFPELVNRLRLQEAARLLIASDRPVGEIANSVGYDEQNYFSRNFKKQYDISPREYRKKLFTGI